MAVDPLLETFGSRQSSPTLTVAVEVINYITPPPGTAETPANTRVIGRRWDTNEIVELALADDVKGAHNRPTIGQFLQDNSANPVTTAPGGTLVLESAKPGTELPALGPDKSAAVFVGRWIVRIANSINEGWALRSMARLNLPQYKDANNPNLGYTQRLQLMDNNQASTVNSINELEEAIYHALDEQYRLRHDAYTRPGFPMAFIRVSKGSESVLRSLMGGSYIPEGDMHKVPKTLAMLRQDLPQDNEFRTVMEKANNVIGREEFTVEVIPGSQLYVGRRTMDKGTQRIYGPTDEHKKPLFTELVVGIRRSPKTGHPQVLFSGTADKSLLPNNTGRPHAGYVASVRTEAASTGDRRRAPQVASDEHRSSITAPAPTDTVENVQRTTPVDTIASSGPDQAKPEAANTAAGDTAERVTLIAEDDDSFTVRIFSATLIQDVKTAAERQNVPWQRVTPGAWKIARDDIPSLLVALKPLQIMPEFTTREAVDQAGASSTPTKTVDIAIVSEADDSFTAEGQTDSGRQMLDETHIAWKGARAETEGHWAISRAHLQTLLGCIKAYDHIHYEMTRREDMDQVPEPAQVVDQKPEAPIESPAAEQKQAAAGASQPSPREQPHADAQMAQNELSPLLKDAYEAATRADKDFQALLVKQYGANAGDARYQYTHADPALNAAATEHKARSQVLHWATMATRCAHKIPAGTAAPGEPMRMKVNAPGPERPQEVLTLVATTPYQAGYLRQAAPQWGLAFDERTGELPLSTTQAETALQDMINEGIAVKAEYVAPPVQQALNPATAQSQTPSDQVAAPVEDAQHGDDLGQLDLGDLDMNFDDALSHAYQQYSQNL